MNLISKKIFLIFFFQLFSPPKMILDNTWLKNKQTHKGQIWFSSHALKHTIFALPEKERKKKNTHTGDKETPVFLFGKLVCKHINSLQAQCLQSISFSSNHPQHGSRFCQFGVFHSKQPYQHSLLSRIHWCFVICQ